MSTIAYLVVSILHLIATWVIFYQPIYLRIMGYSKEQRQYLRRDRPFLHYVVVSPFIVMSIGCLVEAIRSCYE